MPTRSKISGFVLLDALVAFAIAALALTVILTTLPSATVRQADRSRRHQAAEFAYSVMEEYRVTYPLMRVEGEDTSGWAWSILERKAEGTETIQLYDVAVTAWNRDRPGLRATIQGVIARRKE